MLRVSLTLYNYEFRLAQSTKAHFTGIFIKEKHGAFFGWVK